VTSVFYLKGDIGKTEKITETGIFIFLGGKI